MESGEVSLVSDKPIRNREAIRALRDMVCILEQVEPETIHRFAGNLYSRECVQKADVLVIGAIHKQEHFFILLEGEMSIWNNGQESRLVAPCTIISPVGAQRALYAHTDCRYMNIHQVSSRDLAEVEKELIEEDPASMYGVGNKLRPPPLEHT